MLHSQGTALVQRLLRDTSGATAIEYALMAAGIGGTIATTVWGVGADVKANMYDKIASIFQ